MAAGTFSRRQFLLGAATLAVATAVPLKAFASTGHRRALSFRNLHTGERQKGIYWQDGSYLPSTLQNFNEVLKDHRSGEVTQMDPALFDQLTRLSRLLGFDDTIEVISGYRSPATNAALKRAGHNVATHSYHTLGRAIDIRLPGVQLAQAHRAALALKAGGVGYYPRDNFIHMDTGPVRRWGG